MHNGTAVVEIKAVRKSFEGKAVLTDVNLRAGAGESVCVCGANACGKTTLVKIVCGLLKPDGGGVKVCGQNVHKGGAGVKSAIGVVLHESMVYPQLTVVENLRFFAELYGIKEGRRRIEELLGQMLLEKWRDRKAEVLSHGTVQRLAIARAMLHNPAVLAADEPFAGLDEGAAENLAAVLRRFTEAGGTVLMTAHKGQTPTGCCGQVVQLTGGRIAADGGTGGTEEANSAIGNQTYRGTNL